MDYKEKVIALLNSQELSKEQKEKLENIFPELKEKESEDERIRREIIEYITLYKDSLCDEEYNSWIAWLEKQGNKSVNIDVESMISSYEQRLKSQGGTKYSPLTNMCLTAFRHGVENVLEELNLKKLEKQKENKSNFSDLRIWKYIVDMVLTEKNGIGNYLDNPDTERIAKKLQEKYGNIEKQGDKKLTDDVEPKFKVRDWIINESHDICLIIDIDLENGYYICESNRFGNTEGDFDLTDKAFHLWSINDAKEGDVLYCKAANGTEFIMVLKNITRHGILNSYCRYNSDDGFDINVPSVMSVRDNPKPATKEQRDLLFQKMKEAGYKWNSEKKELKKIGPKKVNANNVIEWLKENVADFWANPCNPNRVINQFKKDFGL